jgi:hypothetical protein
VAARWHVGYVDLTGGAGLLGQVEGRGAASVSHSAPTTKGQEGATLAQHLRRGLSSAVAAL